MSAPDIIVEARGLVLSTHVEAAPFDLVVRAGEHWLLQGRTRSGKSPLLKTLCGLISPAAGEVVLFGNGLHDIAQQTLLKLRRNLGFVFSQDGLMPAWSGFENLALPLKYHGRARDAEIIARVEAFATRYGVPSEWLDQPVTNLSPEKRLALSLLRAVLIQPKLLLIDGIALDALIAFSGIRVDALLAEALAEHCTVMLSLPDGVERVPLALSSIDFRRAEMRAGTLELLN